MKRYVFRCQVYQAARDEARQDDFFQQFTMRKIPHSFSPHVACGTLTGLFKVSNESGIMYIYINIYIYICIPLVYLIRCHAIFPFFHIKPGCDMLIWIACQIFETSLPKFLEVPVVGGFKICCLKKIMVVRFRWLYNAHGYLQQQGGTDGLRPT